MRHVRIDPAEGPPEERPADDCRFAGIPDAQGGPGRWRPAGLRAEVARGRGTPAAVGGRGRGRPAGPRAEVAAAVMGTPPMAPGPHREAA